MEERGMEVLHKHHNMKIKSFRIMTRAAKDLQRRAITEPEKAEGLKPYDGVLQVDITKSRGQYGCERRIYSPLLRKAIQGSYEEFTPWLDHLPPRLHQLIVDHQVAYGCVRVVFVALPGSALPALLDSFLKSDIANRLATGSNNQPANLTSMPLPLSQFKETAIDHVQIRDAPVVGLRQAREAKCGRQLQTDTDHGHHFEYLAEFPDGSTHWYPSVLIAKDLTEEFEDLSMKHASEVADITESKGTELTVRRRNNTVDHVHQNQVFWAEEPPEEYLPLHDEEIDGLVKHGHDDEHLDVCVPATLTFRSDWAKFETTTAGTTVRRDDAFDARVYENVTFTNTSIMWGKEHAYRFQQRSIPFVIVNHGAFTNIKVSHGRDGSRLGDMAGSASVTYAAETYQGSTDDGTAFSRTPLFKIPTQSYAIHLNIDQPPRQTFVPVEKVVWSGTNSASTNGWISTDTSDHTLVMNNSGKSGALLLQSSRGERVFVVVGVHNYVRWCDIVTSISPADSVGKVLAMYYGDGEKAFMRWRTLSEHSVRSAAGTNFRVRFEVAEGHQLTAKFSIG
ncbi:fungal fruit body lectin-domain-containing protein [Biscogniauxia mediterranea]|nr:fungal fruit body lectin-domain-containing protein [Biscogniauxia mediterranea]